MELHKWFSTPIGIVNFGEMSRAMNKELIRTIDHELDVLGNKENRSWADNSSSTVNNLINHTCFKQLNQVVGLSFRNIMHEYGYTKKALSKWIYASYYWGNRASKGGWSRPHYHGTGETLWTGVYYPNGYESPEENLDQFVEEEWVFNNIGNINPGGFLCLQDSSFTTKGVITPNNSDILGLKSDFALRKWIKPRQGLLILFPAWQDHFVEPINTDENRYSISFAIEVRRK